MLGVFLDTETGGLNPHKHVVLEVAYKVVNVQTGEVVTSFSSIVSQSRARFEQSDPSSLQVNGFTWEHLLEGLPPEKVAGAIITSLSRSGVRRGEAVFICQNPSFDKAFFSQLIDPDLQESLGWPYHWLDLASMYWTQQIQNKQAPWKGGVSKDKISSTFELPPEEKPHRAMNGVDHLLLCYEAVVGFPDKSCVKNL